MHAFYYSEDVLSWLLQKDFLLGGGKVNQKLTRGYDAQRRWSLDCSRLQNGLSNYTKHGHGAVG
jgi:hypothetical protein